MTDDDRRKAIERYRKEGELQVVLDYLCRATGRDIFVMLPEDVEERNPYLIKEIKDIYPNKILFKDILICVKYKK